jgi:hypothetical protein
MELSTKVGSLPYPRPCPLCFAARRPRSPNSYTYQNNDGVAESWAFYHEPAAIGHGKQHVKFQGKATIMARKEKREAEDEHEGEVSVCTVTRACRQKSPSLCVPHCRSLALSVQDTAEAAHDAPSAKQPKRERGERGGRSNKDKDVYTPPAFRSPLAPRHFPDNILLCCKNPGALLPHPASYSRVLNRYFLPTPPPLPENSPPSPQASLPPSTPFLPHPFPPHSWGSGLSGCPSRSGTESWPSVFQALNSDTAKHSCLPYMTHVSHI